MLGYNDDNNAKKKKREIRRQVVKKKKSVKKEEKSLKEIKQNRFINSFKKKWLIKGTTTVILIAILIAIFVLINVLVKKWDPQAIDCTTSRDFTLTEESKNRVKDIDKDVNIYFVGWDGIEQSEMASYYNGLSEQYELAKQYSKANSKIKVKTVDTTKNLELAKKYNVSNEDYSIIVESGKNSRTLTIGDLVTYDENYNTTIVAEQKITSAIINVTSEKIPKVYFLTGYTSFDLSEEGYMSLFKEYLENEVLTYESLNILNTQKVPDDCDTLIIMTPEKDFDEITANSIIKYIKKGGNILWFNGVYTEDTNYKNVNKVLAEYGVNGFEKGVVYETDSNNIILGYPTCFKPTIEDSTVLKDVKASMGAIFLNPTKININEDKLEELKVEETHLIESGETTYFTKKMSSKNNEDEKGPFVLGAELEKTISEAVESTDEKEAKDAVVSKLIIFSDDFFISDEILQDTSGNQYPVIYLGNNADVALNSIAHLTNNDQEITIRKSYSDSVTSFVPTDKEKGIILVIIFIVPILIIVFGIVVWILRRRKK